MARILPMGIKGFTLIEVLVSIALLGIIGAGFLGALVTSSRTLIIADVRQTAKNFAEAQLEYMRSLPYDVSYAPSSEINSVYPSFSVVTQLDKRVHGESLHSRDINIQKLTIAVQHQDNYVLSIVGFKENRQN
jgi:prepilin-type N-terminal cleavage/methylation domain-containing protein